MNRTVAAATGAVVYLAFMGVAFYALFFTKAGAILASMAFWTTALAAIMAAAVFVSEAFADDDDWRAAWPFVATALLAAGLCGWAGASLWPA